MEEKIKVVLLGNDKNLLSNVSKKVSDSRPAEVRCFVELRDFLEFVIENKPDLVGLSVSFPHKSTHAFPKVFKMALNVPVLTFAENQDLRTRKLMSASRADLKINGVITAHNLWMKIVNLQKLQDQEEEGADPESRTEESQSKKSNMVFLKSKPTDSSLQNKNTMLSSLFAALDDPSKASNLENMNLIKSGDATTFTKDGISHMGGSSDPNQVKTKGFDQVSGGETTNSSSLQGDHPLEKSNRSEGTSSPLDGLADSLQGLLESEPAKESSVSAEKKSNFSKGKGSESSVGLKKESDEGPELSNGTEGFKDELPQPREEEDKNNTSDPLKDDPNLKNAGNRERLQKKDDREEGDGAKKESASNQGQVSSDLSKQPENKTGENTKNRTAGDFGKVELSDEKELKKELARKNKELKEKEDLRKKGILQASCELGLEKVYGSKITDTQLPYEVNSLVAYIIESGSFKGYLILGESRKIKEKENIKLFREVVLENLKKNNMHCEISHEYWLQGDVQNYSETVTEFSEFTINYTDPEGFQQTASFVKREAVRPSFDDSDKPDMYNVDIKVIPPQTPVTFDAFLYLPKNKRFVRYLKEGRSLSLKQAKRHGEEPEQSKLYLPKEQKDRFVGFFIQNTLNWEFALHKKKDVA